MKFLPLLAALTAASTDAQSPINNNPDPTTVAPSPAPTADAAGILGWYTFQEKWFTSACLPGASYTTLSSFANCQKGTAFPTACRSNSIMYNDGSHLNCDLDRCETATVYESRGGKASSAVLCYATAAFREEPRTFYRTTFALSEPTGTGSGSSVTTSTGSPTTSNGGSTTSNAGTTSNGSPTTSTGSGTTSAAATPTVVLNGGRAVFWAGVTTVVMMGLGAVMFI